MARNKRPITQAEFRVRFERETGATISKGQVSKDVSAGMPLSSFEDAMAWRAKHKDQSKPKAKGNVVEFPASRGEPPPAKAVARAPVADDDDEAAGLSGALSPEAVEEIRRVMARYGVKVGEDVTYGEARAFRELIKGLREEVAYDQQLRSVVPIADVLRLVAKQMGALRKVLDTLPTSCAPSYALMTEAPMIEADLRLRINEALAELTTDAYAKLASG